MVRSSSFTESTIHFCVNPEQVNFYFIFVKDEIAFKVSWAYVCTSERSYMHGDLNMNKEKRKLLDSNIDIMSNGFQFLFSLLVGKWEIGQACIIKTATQNATNVWREAASCIQMKTSSLLASLVSISEKFFVNTENLSCRISPRYIILFLQLLWC